MSGRVRAHINLTSDLSTFVEVFFAFLAAFFSAFFAIFRSFFCLTTMRSISGLGYSGRFKSSGGLAMLAAMRRVSSLRRL